MSDLDELKKRYRVEDRIEQLPTVDRYSAYDLQEHRSVMLHVLRHVHAVLRQRVMSALALLSELEHPNLMSILDIGLLDDGKRCFWTTPSYVPLASHAGGSMYSPEPAHLVSLLSIVLQALAAAHTANLIHRRVGWSALVRVDDRICLSDFSVPAHCSIADERAVEKLHVDEKTDDVLSALRMALEVATANSKLSTDKTWDEVAAKLHDLSSAVGSGRWSATETAKALLAMGIGHAASALLTVSEQREAVVQAALRLIGFNLPVLAAVVGKTRPAKRSADTIVLHINHCLEDVFLLDKLFKDIFATSVYVTVPYGRQRIPNDYPGIIYHSIISLNNFELFCCGQAIGERAATFGDAMKQLIYRALVDSIIPALKEGQRLIVVEDGGYHYEPLRRCFDEGRLAPEQLSGVIEQTMAGAIRCAAVIREYGVPYPALTLARSNIKMRYEAFFIGRRVVDELAYLLYQYNEFLAMRRVLIVGYGIIGRSVAHSLRGMACKVSIMDISQDVCKVARNDGYEVISSDLAGFFDSEAIVIGATGDASFTLSMLAEFACSTAKRVFLVSASSKRTEFSEIIRFFEGDPRERGELTKAEERLSDICNVTIENISSGLSYKFRCAGEDKTAILVARGFPVNFFRDDGFSLTMAMIDPINAQLVLLANHAAEFGEELLPNQLYALGLSPLPGLPVSEEDVLEIWRETRGVTKAMSDANTWWGFPIHPAEGYLRMRCLDEAVIVSGGNL